MDKDKANGRAKGGIEGEGSYSATADYKKRQAEYLKKGTVEKDAQDAKQALESDRGSELKDAEAKGRSRAK